MLKCPGTIGTTFAKIIAAVTRSPKMAAMRPGNRGFMRQYEAQAAIQPTAAATAPTSRIGTRPASPRSRARADAIPTAITALEGVRFEAWTYPIRGASRCLRPMANSRREAATMFALYVRNTATSADTSIRGTVTDPSGSVVPRATVVLAAAVLENGTDGHYGRTVDPVYRNLGRPTPL